MDGQTDGLTSPRVKPALVKSAKLLLPVNILQLQRFSISADNSSSLIGLNRLTKVVGICSERVGSTHRRHTS